MKCVRCENRCIKKGKSKNGKQRYYCKQCRKYCLEYYDYHACEQSVNDGITKLLKEGMGILSISRLLHISKNTVMSRILKIANTIKPPPIPMGKEYQLDELCTYIGNKTRKRWIAYSIDQKTRRVVNFVVGTRTKRTLLPIVNSILLAHPTKINTDKLNIYRSLIPKELHRTKQYAINHIERLNRRTICYSKSLTMLVACLKIYFWG